MIRGTTPTHTFTLPFDTGELDSVYITYAQAGKTKIEKSIEDCMRDGNRLSVQLTQEETLSLTSGYMTDIQIAARVGGTVMRSQIIQVQTHKILKEEAI